MEKHASINIHHIYTAKAKAIEISMATIQGVYSKITTREID